MKTGSAVFKPERSGFYPSPPCLPLAIYDIYYHLHQFAPAWFASIMKMTSIIIYRCVVGLALDLHQCQEARFL